MDSTQDKSGTYAPLGIKDKIKVLSLPLLVFLIIFISKLPNIPYFLREKPIPMFAFLILLIYLPTLIFLIFGTFLMKSKKKFSPLTNTLYFIFVYFSLWIIYITNMFSTRLIIEKNIIGNERVIVFIVLFLVFSAIALICFYMLKFLYYAPLNRHQEWIIKNGIFSKTEKLSSFSKNSKSTQNTTPLNIEIQNLINETNDRDIIVNKLKKMLLPQGYKATIEEEYLIQFKKPSLFGKSIINIDLEPYHRQCTKIFSVP